MKVVIKRVYETPEPEDEFRVLVDRIWPRGLSKAKLPYDCWAKELAPSNELRRWFDHTPDRWTEFKALYFAELRMREAELDTLLMVPTSRLTLLYSARDKRHNQALALKILLDKKLRQTSQV